MRAVVECSRTSSSVLRLLTSQDLLPTSFIADHRLQPMTGIICFLRIAFTSILTDAKMPAICTLITSPPWPSRVSRDCQLVIPKKLHFVAGNGLLANCPGHELTKQPQIHMAIHRRLHALRRPQCQYRARAVASSPSGFWRQVTCAEKRLGAIRYSLRGSL